MLALSFGIGGMYASLETDQNLSANVDACDIKEKAQLCKTLFLFPEKRWVISEGKLYVIKNEDNKILYSRWLARDPELYEIFHNSVVNWFKLSNEKAENSSGKS